jgi:hypothetical protein
MAPKLAKFLRLAPGDRRLLMRAAMTLIITKLALKTRPFIAAHKAAIRSQTLLRAPVPPPSAERIVWAVETAGRLIPGLRNCLVQALAAEAILLGARHSCELRIGVAKDQPGEFLAHAWLESGGKVLIGAFQADSYTPLAEQPQRR